LVAMDSNISQSCKVKEKVKKIEQGGDGTRFGARFNNNEEEKGQPFWGGGGLERSEERGKEKKGIKHP